MIVIFNFSTPILLTNSSTFSLKFELELSVGEQEVAQVFYWQNRNKDKTFHPLAFTKLEGGEDAGQH